MLRAVVLLLILANALFFAWTQGWLAPMWPPPLHGERDPARLAAQVRPELITVLSPKAASAALSAARAASTAAGEGDACLEAGPFGEADFARAEAALEAASVPRESWRRREASRGLGWAVYLGRFADAEVMRAKSEELRRLRVEPQELQAPPELAPGLVVGRYDSKEAADAALPQWAERGVRTARVVALPAPPQQSWLRVERAEPALRDQLREIKSAALGSGFAACRENGR